MDSRSGWINFIGTDWVYGNGDGTVKAGEGFCENGTWYYFRKERTYSIIGWYYKRFTGQWIQ